MWGFVLIGRCMVVRRTDRVCLRVQGVTSLSLQCCCSHQSLLLYGVCAVTMMASCLAAGCRNGVVVTLYPSKFVMLFSLSCSHFNSVSHSQSNSLPLPFSPSFSHLLFLIHSQALLVYICLSLFPSLTLRSLSLHFSHKFSSNNVYQ